MCLGPLSIVAIVDIRLIFYLSLVRKTRAGAKSRTFEKTVGSFYLVVHNRCSCSTYLVRDIVNNEPHSIKKYREHRTRTIAFKNSINSVHSKAFMTKSLEGFTLRSSAASHGHHSHIPTLSHSLNPLAPHDPTPVVATASSHRRAAHQLHQHTPRLRSSDDPRARAENKSLIKPSAARLHQHSDRSRLLSTRPCDQDS